MKAQPNQTETEYRNKVILELYKDTKLKTACRNIAGSDYAEDLFHEVILAIYDQPFDKLKRSVDNGYIKWLFFKIATNQFNSKNGSFYTKFRHKDIKEELGKACFDMTNDNEEQELKEALIVRVEKAMNEELDWFDKTLVELFSEFKSVKKVSEQTNIPYKTASASIKGSIEKIKQIAKHELKSK